jgi:hypothetical protein
VACRQTTLTEDQLTEILDAAETTKPGLTGAPMGG